MALMEKSSHFWTNLHDLSKFQALSATLRKPWDYYTAPLTNNTIPSKIPGVVNVVAEFLVAAFFCGGSHV